MDILLNMTLPCKTEEIDRFQALSQLLATSSSKKFFIVLRLFRSFIGHLPCVSSRGYEHTSTEQRQE